MNCLPWISCSRCICLAVLFIFNLASATDWPGGITIVTPNAGGGSNALCTEMAQAMRAVVSVPVSVRVIPDVPLCTDWYMDLPPTGQFLFQQTDSILTYATTHPDHFINLMPILIAHERISHLFVAADAPIYDLSALAQLQQPITIAIDADPRERDAYFIEERFPLGVQVDISPKSLPLERVFSVITDGTTGLIEQPEDVDPFLEQGLIRSIHVFQGRQASHWRPGFRALFIHKQTPPAAIARMEDCLRQAAENIGFKAFNDPLCGSSGFRPIIGVEAASAYLQESMQEMP